MHRTSTMARPRYVCQMCESMSVQRSRVATPTSPSRLVSLPRPASQPRRPLSTSRVVRTPSPSPITNPAGKLLEATSSGRLTAQSPPNLPPSYVLDLLGYRKSSVLVSPAPTEESVSEALGFCDTLASMATDETVQIFSHGHWAQAIKELDSTASVLLSLDGETASQPTSTSASTTERTDRSITPQELVDKVSNTAYLILAHPPVLITPKLLKQYVKIQAKLKKPDSLPKIFQLYASKPALVKDSVPPRYSSQNPDRAANAIEPEVIEMALDSAIEVKNLDAAVGIVENGYATKAFIRSKLLRHGLLPGTTLVATPFAAYILATNFSSIQQAMDVSTATNVAFAGILAYVGFTASIGIVALTTANDQMKRVTWAPGIPLRKRWIREEERAALDKVACAWGFQEEWRRGEEVGADWEALREYIGQKGMILDRTELLEGMD
ncbi:hypothetical protein F5Y17DRAFT_240205 [Xylariaceae sp. FL0594]|nr:hypothetical protein F5Y17DRAFT_240205 [Xylariaceae sp. FL0594]